MSNLIIFDLDGVITSEEAYWDAAGMTLHELLYSPRYWNIERREPGSTYHPVTTAKETRRVSRSVFPEAEIMALKARAINSNWDTCYSTVCLHLIDMLSRFSAIDPLLPLKPWDGAWLKQFRNYEPGYDEQQVVHLTLSGVFDAAIFRGYVGLELINRFDAYGSEKLGHPITDVFSRHSPFWTFCQSIFQEWYLGDELYTRTYGHAPAQSGKPGCIHFEQPLLPVEQLRATLATLREQGYTLGVATGRVRQEALMPLKMYGLLPYFDESHMGTYDYVERAEAQLRAKGDSTLLSKPHPFQFLIAIDSNYNVAEQSNVPVPHNSDNTVIAVGDSTSDILGGHAAGALTVAVLTGARTAEARELLAKSNPDFTIADVTKLPALLTDMDSLATIQRLQFTDKGKAERLLQRWFARHMQLATESVTLTPKAVSLNSFNGFYRANGEDFFFKTHVEEQGVLEEYYHAELLRNAGYTIVVPLRTLHEEGRQMVIYPVIRWPVMFDLMRDVETGKATDDMPEILIDAERRECERLLDIYSATLAECSAAENARAPIHQLFWHRIVGGRMGSFYAGQSVAIPGSQSMLSFEEILTKQWAINGVVQQYTLGELIERAKIVLDPRRAAMTVTGHGDAHFGNVFLEGESEERDYLYFDPAFAGQHSPLLDIIKPLFHNVFATWMYFPEDIAANLHLSVSVQENTLHIEHDYVLTPIRQAILRTKIEYLFKPLISGLWAKQALPDDWQEIMWLALLCCPLLTVNLFDSKRMPEKISWLGLSFAVQMGNSGVLPWREEH